MITQSGTEMYSIAATWGAAGSGDGQFNSPKGIAIDSTGYVYVVDSRNNRIQKFDPNGNFITKWGTEGAGNGQFKSPHGIAADDSGNIYVVDSGNNRIQKFDPNGNFITKWGTEGAGNGEFKSPLAIAVAPSGYVFVGDNGNGRIQKFDLSGNFLSWWVPARGIGQAIATDPLGNVYAGVNTVEEFDANGNLKGGYPVKGGQGTVSALTIDISGQVYVSYGGYTTATSHNLPVESIVKIDSVQPKYVPGENYTSIYIEWGSDGSGDNQFQGITGLALDAVGIVYVVDSGNNRIEKFAPMIGEQNVLKVDAYANSTANAWLDTGFDISAGEQVTMTTTGSACLGPSLNLCQGPAGGSGNLKGCPAGSLVAKIGNGSQFCVGMTYQQVARSSGRLSLAYNDENYYDNSGTFYVTLNVNTKTTDASPVYRFLNTGLGVFFYTIYESERDFILQNLPQYQLNGTAYFAFTTQRPGTFPVYRFLNKDLGVFFYTIHESEKDFILQNLPQYQLNGIAYYAYMIQPPGASPVYRFLNTALGVFFYTIYESERDFILQNLPQYQLNGIAFYAYK
jgi:streptogramin lyase